MTSLSIAPKLPPQFNFIISAPRQYRDKPHLSKHTHPLPPGQSETHTITSSSVAHHVRHRSRIHPRLRRPALQTSHQKTRPNPRLRPSLPTRHPLCPPRPRNPHPPFRRPVTKASSPSTPRDCHQRPGFLGWCRQWRVSRVQGGTEAGE